MNWDNTSFRMLRQVDAGVLNVGYAEAGRRWSTVRLERIGPCGRILGMSTTSNPYRGFRFPAEIINQAVWLYHCFSLSLRDVELILAARGIVVSYETIRGWSLRFGRPRQDVNIGGHSRRQMVFG